MPVTFHFILFLIFVAIMIKNFKLLTQEKKKNHFSKKGNKNVL